MLSKISYRNLKFLFNQREGIKMYAFLAILTVCLIMHYENNSLSVLSFQFFLESYTSAATTGYSYNKCL